MQVVRVYTGSDGESHLEELDLGYEAIAEAERTAMKTASGIQFRRDPPGRFQDFHVAPRRQFVITLEGQAEIGWVTAPSGSSTPGTFCWPTTSPAKATPPEFMETFLGYRSPFPW